MYAKFNLDISEVKELEEYSKLRKEYEIKLINPDVGRMEIRPILKSLVKGKIADNNIIDGAVLTKYIFPIGEDGKYNVFISYSHDDKDLAIFLASWLEQQCCLKVFLDEYVWGSADGLLKDIDDNYCKQKDGRYNYRRRNYSTSHVHAMLSMAIMDIINNTECCIFINSGHSIHLHSLKNETTSKTLSPWIYEENKMMRLLPSRITQKESLLFYGSEKVEPNEIKDSFNLAHSISFEGFKNLTCSNLLNMKDKGTKGLDELYLSFVGNQIMND